VTATARSALPTLRVGGAAVAPTHRGPLGPDRVSERAAAAWSDWDQTHLREFSQAPEARQRRWSR
jgi:hypothetical protein